MRDEVVGFRVTEEDADEPFANEPLEEGNTCTPFTSGLPGGFTLCSESLSLTRREALEPTPVMIVGGSSSSTGGGGGIAWPGRRWVTRANRAG